jgi:hypothetical protein
VYDVIVRGHTHARMDTHSHTRHWQATSGYTYGRNSYESSVLQSTTLHYNKSDLDYYYFGSIDIESIRTIGKNGPLFGPSKMAYARHTYIYTTQFRDAAAAAARYRVRPNDMPKWTIGTVKSPPNNSNNLTMDG